MIPKNIIKSGKKVWKYTNQSFADWFIYEDGDDLALINEQGEIEKILLDARKLGDYD